jgi:hypothetical protein
MDMFEPFAATVHSVTLYAECYHSWWTKLREDWIRLRRHPSTHIVLYSPFYERFKATLMEGAPDLDQDTIKISLTTQGTFSIEDPRE